MSDPDVSKWRASNGGKLTTEYPTFARVQKDLTACKLVDEVIILGTKETPYGVLLKGKGGYSVFINAPGTDIQIDASKGDKAFTITHKGKVLYAAPLRKKGKKLMDVQVFLNGPKGGVNVSLKGGSGELPKLFVDLSDNAESGQAKYNIKVMPDTFAEIEADKHKDGRRPNDITISVPLKKGDGVAAEVDDGNKGGEHVKYWLGPVDNDENKHPTTNRTILQLPTADPTKNKVNVTFYDPSDNAKKKTLHFQRGVLLHGKDKPTAEVNPGDDQGTLDKAQKIIWKSLEEALTEFGIQRITTHWKTAAATNWETATKLVDRGLQQIHLAPDNIRLPNKQIPGAIIGQEKC